MRRRSEATPCMVSLSYCWPSPGGITDSCALSGVAGKVSRFPAHWGRGPGIRDRECRNCCGRQASAFTASAVPTTSWSDVGVAAGVLPAPVTTCPPANGSPCLSAGGLSPAELPVEFFPPSLKFRVGFSSPEQAPRCPEPCEPVFIRVLHSLGVNITVSEPRWVPLHNGVKQCPQLQRSTQSLLRCLCINVGKRWVDRAAKGSGTYHPVHGPQRAVGAQPAQNALPHAFYRREEFENPGREENEKSRNAAYYGYP